MHARPQRRTVTPHKDWPEFASNMSFWEFLARERKTTLPRRSALTMARAREVLVSKDATLLAFQDWTGFSTLRQFIKANPGFSTRAFAGLILEYKVLHAE